MRLFVRDEGSLTLVEWDGGYIGVTLGRLNRKVHVDLERWPCCPGSFNMSATLFGLGFDVLNEGGHCHLDDLMDDLFVEPVTIHSLRTQAQVEDRIRTDASGVAGKQDEIPVAV